VTTNTRGTSVLHSRRDQLTSPSLFIMSSI
jgi:hypothetical protein